MKNKQLVDSLRKEFINMDLDQSVSTNWWGNFQKQMHNLVDSGADPNYFFTWAPIISTMYCGSCANCTLEQINYLKSLHDWDKRWKIAIEEKGEFDFPRFQNYNKSIATTIHHAYHISMFEFKTGIKISDMNFIFEFGGGYGDTCRIIHRLGFKGNYIICDLPEFSALQRFFLIASGITVSKGKVDLINDIDNIEMLIPKENINKCAISTWAIEETTPSLISKFTFYMTKFNHFLFAMGGDGEFLKIKESLQNIDWFFWGIPFINGHNYLMGRTK